MTFSNTMARSPASRRPKLVIVQEAAVDYRKGFFEQLIRELGSDFHLLAGRDGFTPAIVANIDLGPSMTTVSNRFFAKRKLLFQHGVIGPCVKAEIVVLELNPRILSGWIVLLTRKFLGKRSILWGHAWPRAGKNSRTDWLRGWMRSLAQGIIVYTQTEATELSQKMPGMTIIAAHNALYAKAKMAPLCSAQTPTNFIYVGRLIPGKKPQLLLDAFSIAVKSLPDACNLIFVGSGPLRESLIQRTADLGLSDRVEFPGHIADIGRLKELYGRSIASVSPGYVGLSLIQSLSFGVPMIIAADEPHSPEIEAAREDRNTRAFVANSAEALAQELVHFSNNADQWYKRREAISQECRDHYSVEAMVAAFLAATGEHDCNNFA